MKEQNIEIIESPEYKAYLAALARLASGYVSRIRVQFAERAYDKYQDATTRRVVLAYGEEIDELDRQRNRDFAYCARFGSVSTGMLEDSCLNNAGHYAQTIKLLFDIA